MVVWAQLKELKIKIALLSLFLMVAVAEYQLRLNPLKLENNEPQLETSFREIWIGLPSHANISQPAPLGR